MREKAPHTRPTNPSSVGESFRWPWQKKKKSVNKAVNQDFVDYANTKKIQEFQRYLKSVSQYVNNPLSELFKQRGMLLETCYAGKNNKDERNLIHQEVAKIDKMVDRILKENEHKNYGARITKS